jgi:nitrous oxide reductase accessory protein NosL
MKNILIFVALLGSFLFAETHNDKPFEVQKSFEIVYDKNTSCLVRNFKLYKDPKWVAKIEVRSGKTAYFSSPKSLFEFYHRPGKWFDMGVKSERDFNQIVVMDYITHKAIDAELAFFVYGSNIISPAGDDLVPFASKEDAEAFAKTHNGKRIFKFDEVKDALIRLLNGRI